MEKYRQYLPELLGVLLGLLSICLWAAISIAVKNEYIAINSEYFLKLVTITIGAFVGAYSAFKLNAKKDFDKQREKNIAELNKSLFVLVRMIVAVKNMAKDLAEFKTDLDRAFSLPAAKPPNYDDLRFDFEELVFLLDENPQILLELAIEQERFEQTFSAISIRNDFYVNEIQPALSDLGINGRNIKISDFANALGERLFEGAINGAKNMYFHVESTDESLEAMHKKLFEVARELFPGQKFIKYA